MNNHQVIKYVNHGFDNKKYFRLQKEAILKRMSHFKSSRLYLELGGHFFHDSHAARCLPGFDAGVKVKLFADLIDNTDIIFCLNYNRLARNRQLNGIKEKYQDFCLNEIDKVENALGQKVIVSVNLCPPKHNQKPLEQQKEETVATNFTTNVDSNPNTNSKFKPSVTAFIELLKSTDHKVYKKYFINGYPENSALILSENGFGHDQHIKLNKNLVLIIGSDSNNGKLSTALSQIYLDHVQRIESGVAKYELFPIWNLPLEHPVNLAYEAATADVGDVGDYNAIDKYHKVAYGEAVVNYNRDIASFELLRTLVTKLSADNHMKTYKSPTDMGINQAGFAITDDQLVCLASYAEIQRRKGWYQDVVERGDGQKRWVNKCIELAKRALKYIVKKGYDKKEK